MASTRLGFRAVIEQAMFFALGFLVAGLLTLMFLPAFWRRAMRLSMRRLQMLAPMSMEEVTAERDLLRAEFAVRERRLEQEMEALRTSKAQDLSAIGRHAARVADAEKLLTEAAAAHRDIQMQLQQAEQIASERADLLQSTELALHEMTDRASNAIEQLRLMQSDQSAQDLVSSSDPVQILRQHDELEVMRRQLAEAHQERAVLLQEKDAARASLQQHIQRIAELEQRQRQGIGAPPPASKEDVAALRAAIVDFGDRVNQIAETEDKR